MNDSHIDTLEKVRQFLGGTDEIDLAIDCHDVYFLARGMHLAALRNSGLSLKHPSFAISPSILHRKGRLKIELFYLRCVRPYFIIEFINCSIFSSTSSCCS